MTPTTTTARKLLAIACAAFLAAAGLAPRTSDSARATAATPVAKLDSTLVDATGAVRVYITLKSNEFVKDLDARRERLIAAQTKLSRRASSIAVAGPHLFTDQERRAARSIERARNRLLPTLREAAAPDVAASRQVAAIIEAGGGRVHQATPLPNAITATVPARMLAILAASRLVDSIAPAGRAPHLMNTALDGSQTWHTNGFIGQGGSADGNGSPDFAAADAGIRTTHLAFRTRLPGDPANGPATGPTRITSPPGRTNFSGSEHGNTVAATVANTDLTQPVWPYFKGLAYGIDKVYDPYQAKSGWHWLAGIAYRGEPGVADLPEAINYSAGIYEDTTDLDTAWAFMDEFTASLGITFSIAAGNCGVQGGGYTDCPSGTTQGPHRVGAPAHLYNVIAVGGLDYGTNPYDSAGWVPWANSSPGPTWGGRKKPDLIHDPYGGAGGPSQQNDTDYVNPDLGTSFAAPAASAGALLLASAGVYTPTAQKAIMINTATPIEGQTYWRPKSGWGALNLDAAFYQRANYADATITGSADNGVRFFRVTGVAAGDRSTLVWNRRTATSSTYYALTDLDLSQHDQATGATTATGGSDAADTVDADQIVSSQNPMPGSGADGADNVEQVRSTASGTQILKVKALTPVDGATAEPFSIASAKPLTALETPVPSVTLDVQPSTVGVGQTATVTADVTNVSSDIALTSTQVTLDAPPGVTITNGSATQTLGTLAAGATATAVWQVSGDTAGLKALGATATGTAYGETFTGADGDDLTVEDSPPTLTVSGPGEWSSSPSPGFSWTASDASGVASYDVATSVAGAAPTPALDDTTETSATFAAPEGATLTVTVSATDNLGNVSAPVSATTTVDAIAPSITVSPTVSPGLGTATITAHNVGSPLSVTAAFSADPAAPLMPLAGSVVQLTNSTDREIGATVRAKATDALGRSATAAAGVVVPSKFIPAALRLLRPKSKGGTTTVTGSLAAEAVGHVTITARRKGKHGTKRRRARATIKSGHFRAKLKLAPGHYKLTVAYPGSSSVLKGSTSMTITVR